MKKDQFEFQDDTIQPPKQNSVEEDFTKLPVGEILRRVRLEHKLDLKQVEEQIRIKALYLEALENGDHERIPGQVYVAGFVKAYADFLNLDSFKMVALLKRQTGHKVDLPPQKIFPFVNEEQRVASKKVILISTGVLVVLLLGWRLGSSQRHADDIPAVPSDLTRQMTALQKPEESKNPPASQALAAVLKPHPVVLKAMQDVWLEIRDDKGQPIFSRVLKQGEEYWVPETASGYKMTTGNAGGLETVVEGVTYPAMGKIAEVRRNVSLNPEDLKSLLKPAGAQPEKH